MAKTKKTETPTDDTIVMEVMPGADPISEEDAKPFEVDLNFENTDSTEGEEIEEEPVLSGYDLNYSDEIQPYTTFANGGLAALPAKFNPMTNVNPFSMMMRGGR